MSVGYRQTRSVLPESMALMVRPRFFPGPYARALPLVAFLLLAFTTSAQDRPFYLHSGDRVVWYGDSITEQARYTTFVEAYVATRFTDLNVRFINSGWAGDWVVGGGGGKIDERLARDVVAHKPTVATFMLGMNDAAYQDFDQAFFDVYSKGYQHLLDSLQETLPNLRITLLEPSPFDDLTRPPQYGLRDGGYNKVLVRYGEFVRTVAQRRNLDVIDMNAPLLAVLEKARLSDPALAQQIIPDRIHPSAAGGLVMAAAILKAWNAPALVSEVEIDASDPRARPRVRRQENSHVGELQREPDLSWTQLDSALPLPLDPADDALALVLRSSEIVDSLDRQILKVTGLPAADYTLKIDREEVHSFSSADLARGVNLATLPTAMLKQSLSVYAILARRHALRMTRWQSVQVGLQKETSTHVAETIAALDALDDELRAEQNSVALPKTHRYELLRQKIN